MLTPTHQLLSYPASVHPRCLIPWAGAARKGTSWNMRSFSVTEKENDAFCGQETLSVSCLIWSEFLHSMKKLFWQKISKQYLGASAVAFCFKSRACFCSKISWWLLLNHALIFITEWQQTMQTGLLLDEANLEGGLQLLVAFQSMGTD